MPWGSHDPHDPALIICLAKQKLRRDFWTADIRLQLNLHSLSTLSNPDSSHQPFDTDSLCNFVSVSKLSKLTSVCTMAGRCVRSVRTVWNTSTTPSYCMRSSTVDRVMNTPVRPTPALSQQTLLIIIMFMKKNVLFYKFPCNYKLYSLNRNNLCFRITSAPPLKILNVRKKLYENTV